MDGQKLYYRHRAQVLAAIGRAGAQPSWLSSAFASFRSAVSHPSVTLDIFEYNGGLKERYRYEQVCAEPPGDGRVPLGRRR